MVTWTLPFKDFCLLPVSDFKRMGDSLMRDRARANKTMLVSSAFTAWLSGGSDKSWSEYLHILGLADNSYRVSGSNKSTKELSEWADKFLMEQDNKPKRKGA